MLESIITTTAGRTASSFAEHVLREITWCVDAKPRGIKAACIVKLQVVYLVSS